ncbi:hypothetical protein PM082_013424 [Marasmius tenuissimus]|nr:hypothetical protein PM082_013424 [Marasmius tenuissimus]
MERKRDLKAASDLIGLIVTKTRGIVTPGGRDVGVIIQKIHHMDVISAEVPGLSSSKAPSKDCVHREEATLYKSKAPKGKVPIPKNMLPARTRDVRKMVPQSVHG